MDSREEAALAVGVPDPEIGPALLIRYQKVPVPTDSSRKVGT